MSRRFEFDVPGGSKASFRVNGRGTPSPAFCLAMQYLASAAIAHQAIVDRACDPRVGDRFVSISGVALSEVIALHEMPDTGLGPGHDSLVQFTHTETGDFIHQLFIGDFRKAAQTAIEGGHQFHAVEDDEDE
jgi:hypothetical protein